MLDAFFLDELTRHTGGEFFGFQAMCLHLDVPLCEGLFDGSTLTCHMHLWQWDIRTGAILVIVEPPLQHYPLSREGEALSLGGDCTAPGGFMPKKGEIFGWPALLDWYPSRSASARCLDDSSVLRINRKSALRARVGPRRGLHRHAPALGADRTVSRFIGDSITERRQS